MPINRFLAKDKLHPEQVERLNKAFDLALRSLGVDRNDPVVDIVIKKILEIATTGIRDPREIADTAIRQLAAMHPRRDWSRTGSIRRWIGWQSRSGSR